MSKDSCLKLHVHLVNITWQTVFLARRNSQVPNKSSPSNGCQQKQYPVPGFTIVFTYLAYYLIYQFQYRPIWPAKLNNKACVQNHNGPYDISNPPKSEDSSLAGPLYLESQQRYSGKNFVTIEMLHE